MPSTFITFNGLLVFRRDRRTKHYEVGVLRARDVKHPQHPHILQIGIKPNPATGTGAHDVPIELLEKYIQDGPLHWHLDIESGGGAGVEARDDKPRDRKEPNSHDQKDFGWIVHIEEEFHGPLKREPKALKPVILLKTGQLSSSCITDFVDVIKNDQPKGFGFIAGAITLEINTSAGQLPVLYFEDAVRRTEILQLKETAKREYHISILNTPMKSTKDDHFHMYYDLVFNDVEARERRAFAPHKPRISTVDRCPELPEPSPNPFRCGGVVVGGDDPLEG